MKNKQHMDETETELVPESEASSGMALDPPCEDDMPGIHLTMMSERGRSNALRAGNQVRWRDTMVRRTP